MKLTPEEKRDLLAFVARVGEDPEPPRTLSRERLDELTARMDEGIAGTAAGWPESSRSYQRALYRKEGVA